MQTFTPEQIEEGNKRLLLAAQATRETKHPSKFTMEQFGHTCDTPGCVLGNYAVRTDLQTAFQLVERVTWNGTLVGGVMPVGEDPDLRSSGTVDCDGSEVRGHFALPRDDASDLFGYSGCNAAKTPDAAAEFIERFVQHRRQIAQESALEQTAQMPAPPEDQSGL